MSQQHDLEFKTRDEWRDWLQHNHKRIKEAWVILYKKKSVKPGLRYNEAVEEALCYGWIDSVMNRVDEMTFRQRFSPRQKRSIWSNSNKERALRLISQGKMRTAGYKAIEEGKQSGKWHSAYSSHTLPQIPADLNQALQRSPNAYRNFQAFPNSTKLMYIHWIQTAKKPSTRVKRINQVVDRAVKNIKPR